jgi:hypothetical protein
VPAIISSSCEIPCQGIVGTLIHVFSANKVNEVTFGANRGAQKEGPLSNSASETTVKMLRQTRVPSKIVEPNDRLWGFYYAVPLQMELNWTLPWASPMLRA